MDNVFKTMGDSLSSVSTGSKKVDGVDKSDILNLVDNNLVALKTVVSTFDDNIDIMKYIQAQMQGSNKVNADLQGLYSEYTKELGYTGRNAESAQILKSLRDAAVILLADHEKIRDNFTSLFDQGTDIGEVQLEQMKLSHAAIFGFINLSSLLCNWFCFFYTSIIGQSGEHLRIPPYREQVIKTNSKRVADLVNDALIRGAKKSILDVITGIRSKGDVILYSKAASLDTYANINEYPGAQQFFGGFVGAASRSLGRLFGSFQPIMWVREIFSSYAHDEYKRNLMMRDWMLTKTSIFRLDMARVDPGSPDYQKQLAILNRYGDQIAALDKKISQYENS